jgi:hypothetical protein
MKRVLFVIHAMFLSSAWATPSYFIGEQKVSKKASIECYVELKPTANPKTVELRAIATNTHENLLIPVGPLQANHQFIGGSFKKNGFYFQDKAPKAPVKQLILVSELQQDPTLLMAAIFHEGHHDPVTCENLSPAVDDELTEAIDLFENFENLDEHEGHDH